MPKKRLKGTLEKLDQIIRYTKILRNTLVSKNEFSPPPPPQTPV